MAVGPLFVTDLAELKRRLRLSGLPDATEDAPTMLANAILAVRVHFNRRLGTARVQQLLGFPQTETPSTEPELLRTLAETVEVDWVRLELMCRLPWLWSDSSGEAQKAWNEEAPFREKGAATYEQLKHCLVESIESALGMLSGSELFGEEQGGRAFDGKPICPAPDIGASLRRFFQD